VMLTYNDSVRRCDGGSSNICATQVAAPLVCAGAGYAGWPGVGGGTTGAGGTLDAAGVAQPCGPLIWRASADYRSQSERVDAVSATGHVPAVP
jgi:hypothetical protein